MALTLLRAAMILLIGIQAFAATLPAADAPLAASAGQSFELESGQSAAVEGSNFVVTFLKVLQDSRCPIGVQCVWAGQASVEIRVEKPPAPAEVRTLTIGGRSDPETEHGGVTITLVDLQPHPRDGVTTEPSDYRASFRVDLTKPAGSSRSESFRPKVSPGCLRNKAPN